MHGFFCLKLEKGVDNYMNENLDNQFNMDKESDIKAGENFHSEDEGENM